MVRLVHLDGHLVVVDRDVHHAAKGFLDSATRSSAACEGVHH
jgi:hypothetical protein